MIAASALLILCSGYAAAQVDASSAPATAQSKANWRPTVALFSAWLEERVHECGPGLLRQLSHPESPKHPDGIPRYPKWFKPAVDHVIEIVREIPRHPLTRPYRAGACRSLAIGLEQAAEASPNWSAFLKRARARVRLRPDEEARLPTGLPEAKFRAEISQWQLFLMKHRRHHPKKPKAARVEDILASKHPVGEYVVVVGTVTKARPEPFGDGDRTFNFGDLHCEIPPEVHRSSPELYFPKPGDVVRARGWTFLDINHRDEESEGNRKSLWELHPVYSVERVASPAP